MKYFKNIHSLSELKKQFRTLAIANHPDKGGDTAVMQEINAEFDAMFQVLKNRPDIPKTAEEQQETPSGFRKRFYTENGWMGCRYDSGLRTADISARIKVYTKERYPDYKFSVRTETFSMGSAIHVRLVSGPVPALTPECTRDYISTMSEIRDYPGITDEVRAVMSDVVDYANSYNYDDSDSMIDYFDTRFYLHIYIGEFNKPYQVVAPKAKKVAGKARKAEALEASAKAEPMASAADESKADAAVLMVDYSAKAVAVIGDTKAIKDDLKAMGGRFNRALTIEGERVAGWIFSKAKEADLMEYINNLNSQPGTLEDVEPMAAPEAIEAEAVGQESEAVAMDEITAGVELLQGLSEEQIYNCLKSASDTLKESPEFWKMINSGDDPAAAISKTALACLLTLGRKIKRGAA